MNPEGPPIIDTTATVAVRRPHGRLQLAAWMVGLAFAWLAVLPWLSALPAHREKLEWLREQRIDPSAIYYTEVDAMEPVLQRLNERERG